MISGAQGTDQATITNKVTIADYFTQELAAVGISFTSSANTLANTAIASVTSAPLSVVLAGSTINTWLTNQPSAGEVALVGVSHASAASSIS